jgi:modulator of FtsH protease HflC
METFNLRFVDNLRWSVRLPMGVRARRLSACLETSRDTRIFSLCALGTWMQVGDEDAAGRRRSMNFNMAGGVLGLFIVALAYIGYQTLFTVSQTHQALIVRLGSPVRIISESGLNAKVPLIDTVVFVDNRILDVENAAEEVFASDQKRIVVDAFARYRIVSPLLFYTSVNSIEGANSRLSALLNGALRRVLGEATLPEVVRDRRALLIARVRDQLDRQAQALGIHVIDVRIRRVNLPLQNSQAVYQRMQTERQREAAVFRASGSQRSQEIRARADRDATVLIAAAMSHGEQVRGAGDAERTQIFAKAYAQDRDFSAFYRSMQAYEAALRGSNTRLVLRPDSAYFRYFGDPSG